MVSIENFMDIVENGNNIKKQLPHDWDYFPSLDPK